MQLAAPVLVTMLVVDLVLGLIGRSVPQIECHGDGTEPALGGRDRGDHRVADPIGARHVQKRGAIDDRRVDRLDEPGDGAFGIVR